MLGFCRIRGFKPALADGSRSPTMTGPDDYLEKLVKMIPAEVVGLYLVGSGIIPAVERLWLLVWTAFCFIAVFVIRARTTSDPSNQKGAQWGAVLVSAVAFVIWVYSMGGPFKEYMGARYHAFLGSLLVLAWTFAVPLIYTPND